MSRRLVLIMCLVAAALTVFSIALSRRDSSDWRSSRARRLFPFPWRDVVAISLVRPGGETFEFRKDDSGEWEIVLAEGLTDSLNPRAVDELSALVMLPWREELPDEKAPAKSGAVVLKATSLSGATATLAFGDVRHSLRTAVLDDDDEIVYGVNQDLAKIVDWPAERYRNLDLFAVKARDKLSKVVLAPAGAEGKTTVVLELTETGWRLTSPVSWPADDTRFEFLTRWLAKFKAGDIVADKIDDPSMFGISPASPFIELAYAGPEGAGARRVYFGRGGDGDLVYAKVDGREAIFSVSKALLDEISFLQAVEYQAEWGNFYRRRVLDILGGELPRRIVVEKLLPEPVKLTLEQRREKGEIRWSGVMEDASGQRSFAVDPPDPNDSMRPLTALLTGLSSIRIKTFLAESAPGEATVKWTAYPAWRISAVAADGSECPALVLYAADAEGALPPGQPFTEGRAGTAEMKPLPGFPERVGMAASLSDRQVVVELFGELAYLLCLPPYRYQTARLVDSDPAKWSRLEVRSGDAKKSYFRDDSRQGEQWWLDGETPEPLMDDNNQFVIALLSLAHLQAAGFAAAPSANPAEFGLDQPRVSVLVYDEEKTPAGGNAAGGGVLFSLDIGDEAPSQAGSGAFNYARLNGNGPIFLVPEGVAASLLRDYR